MKIVAALFAFSHATEDDSTDLWNCWPANDNAPLCGCQKIDRTQNMINSTCTLTLNLVDFDGAAIEDGVQMLTVASSFPFPEFTDLTMNEYKWTGFEELSHENKHDIVVFFRDDVCPFMNLTEIEMGMRDEFSCELHPDGAHTGPLLGNFNYDVARSHQQYNMPIYGMEEGQTVLVEMASHNHVEWDHEFGDWNSNYVVFVQNVTAHHGHGTVAEFDDTCDDRFQYTLNGHQGELEYAQFELCTSDPDFNKEDYKFDVPSSWTTTVTVL